MLGKVSVLSIGPASARDDLAAHLARHDVTAEFEDWPEGHPIAETLLGDCARHDPSLLVMGAYENSKFRKDFLGGVTREVLRNSSIPVLLSH